MPAVRGHHLHRWQQGESSMLAALKYYAFTLVPHRTCPGAEILVRLQTFESYVLDEVTGFIVWHLCPTHLTAADSVLLADTWQGRNPDSLLRYWAARRATRSRC